jgi:hypothetical protein
VPERRGRLIPATDTTQPPYCAIYCRAGNLLRRCERVTGYVSAPGALNVSAGDVRVAAAQNSTRPRRVSRFGR